jgi:alpha-glucosidase
MSVRMPSSGMSAGDSRREHLRVDATLPPGYQPLGPATSVDLGESTVRLGAGSSTVEVAALAPDLFRVGLFPQGRPVDYRSFAVVSRDWQPGPITVASNPDQVTLLTSSATAQLSLDPLRIRFIDRTGRVFAEDDPDLGMGSLATSAEASDLELGNSAGALGVPVRVYKRHQAGERYFGCGERTGELDKTGTRQLFWNVDPPRGHTALQNNLYASIPFTLALHEGQAWGLFCDSATRVEFDLAHDDPQLARFGAIHGDLVYYVFCGPTPRDVLARYTDLTGHTPMPPLWALGYGQSRFSYETADEVREIARSFRERDIPCDTLYFDIDTLDGYRDFTWNPATFPDPKGLLAELKAMGFHAASIVDAGVKVDDGYSVYGEGHARDLFCKTPHGDDYQNAVWPGVCTFPDFTNPQTRAWWGEQHRALLDAGVEGIWADMNEPGLFIPLNSTMPPDVVHPGDGRAQLHIQVHNAYGSLMVQAAREGMLRLRPERRPFVLSRSGYAGIQRHASLWTGDNSSTWDHLTMSISQLNNLGLSGVAWAGVDIGGYYGDATGELLARWMEFGIFQPFCRNHSEKETRHQEPWVFGEPYESACRDMLKLRQRLLPYIYTLFEECHRTGAPILRPLLWAHPEDSATYSLDDEFLLGDSLLVAPVTRPGVEYRHVYLPRGTWFHFWTGARLDGPAHVLAHAPLGRPAIYVRANNALPLWPEMNHVGESDADPLTLILYPRVGSGSTALYEDAGDGFEYLDGSFSRRAITCDVGVSRIQIVIGEQEGTFVPVRSQVRLELREIAHGPASVQVGNEPAAWRYDSEQRRLIVDLHEMTSSQLIDVSL